MVNRVFSETQPKVLSFRVKVDRLWLIARAAEALCRTSSLGWGHHSRAASGPLGHLQWQRTQLLGSSIRPALQQEQWVCASEITLGKERWNEQCVSQSQYDSSPGYTVCALCTPHLLYSVSAHVTEAICFIECFPLQKQSLNSEVLHVLGVLNVCVLLGLSLTLSLPYP